MKNKYFCSPFVPLFVLLFLFLLATSSCKKFIEVDPPIDKVTAGTVFQNDETAAAAVNGIYSQMMATSLFYSSGGVTVYAGLSADELFLTNNTVAEQAEFEANTLSPANGILWSDFWLRAYKMIYQTNTCIDNLSASTSLSPDVKDRLKGEALFLRAFHYFLLTNMYGAVPLVTTTDYTTSGSIPRTAPEVIYSQVITDLADAKRLLPATYSGNGRIRPNKWAASALLARVHLYRQHWAEAEREATEVVSSGVFTLVPNPANVFLATSNEAIWQLAPVVPGFNTTEARVFVPLGTGTTKPSFALRAGLIAAFENVDTRKSAWVGSKTVGTETIYFPFKYKVRNLNLPVTENYMVLRFAEVLLIRAEARARQNKISEGKADLNTIRIRAGLAPSTVLTSEQLLTAIEKERRIELFAEWGHRWFDLKRTGRVDAVLSPLKPGWRPDAALFPIPLPEILRNPSLIQNPGY